MAAMMQTLNKSAVFGQTAELKGSRTPTAAVRCPVVVRAQQEVRCGQLGNPIHPLGLSTHGQQPVLDKKPSHSQAAQMLIPPFSICAAWVRLEPSVTDLSSHFASQVSRRAGLGMLAAGAALLTRTAPSEAAYGEAANIFGKAGNQAGAPSPNTREPFK